MSARDLLAKATAAELIADAEGMETLVEMFGQHVTPAVNERYLRLAALARAVAELARNRGTIEYVENDGGDDPPFGFALTIGAAYFYESSLPAALSTLLPSPTDDE